MIDLHLHLDGSLTPEDILSLAELSGISLPHQTPDALRPLLEVAPGCRNLGEYLEKFDLPLQVLQTKETISLSVYFLLRRLKDDGLCYAEIRFAPQLHQNRGLSQRQVVAAAVEGLQKGIGEFGLPAQLILCCMRGDNNQTANLQTVRTAKEFLGKGVCAVDLAGNETAYPTEDFDVLFNLAELLRIPIIIHAGEAAGPQSVRQALSFGAKRIGHGVRSIEDPMLMELLARKQTPLELCFTSNLQTKAVEQEQKYPLCEFLRQGICVTINTDNMTVSGTNLRTEYRLLQTQFGLSADTLQTIACNAADSAFVTKAQADVFKAQISKNFAQWLA